MYADSKVCKLILDELNNLSIKYNYYFPDYGMAGPDLVTKVAHDNKLYDGILNNKFFYSIQFENKDFYIKSDLNKLAKSCITESYLTHIWNVRHVNENKEKGSLLDELFNGVYKNEEVAHAGLLYKQNNYYNRFIEISKLHHQIFNKSPENEQLKFYILSKYTVDELNKLKMNY
jgi:hypothetical protein